MRRALHNDAPRSAKLPPDRDARNCGTAGGEAIIVHSHRCCIMRTACHDETGILHSLTKSNFLLDFKEESNYFLLSFSKYDSRRNFEKFVVLEE